MIDFTGLTHIGIAVFLYFCLFPFNLEGLAGVIIGAIFPDIDTPHSILGRFNVFSYFMKHRGITHTLVGMLAFAWLVNAIFPNISDGFIFGYFTHLVADSLTPTGIMWLYPYRKNYYGIFGKKKNPRRMRG